MKSGQSAVFWITSYFFLLTYPPIFVVVYYFYLDLWSYFVTSSYICYCILFWFSIFICWIYRFKNTFSLNQTKDVFFICFFGCYIHMCVVWMRNHLHIQKLIVIVGPLIFFQESEKYLCLFRHLDTVKQKYIQPKNYIQCKIFLQC